jgi:catechol 2,3-dioxygenase-like lactoylglutathione lyase family enzyme
VTDLARARKFYEGMLGLKPTCHVQGRPSSGYVTWVEYDLGGGTLGIGTYPQWKPSRDGAIPSPSKSMISMKPSPS